MNNDDYLGIIGWALNELALKVVEPNAEDKEALTRKLLMVQVAEAAISWKVQEESVKEKFISDMKASIDVTNNWVEKHLVSQLN